MGSVMGCVEDLLQSKSFKRVNILCSVVVSYTDVVLDATNAYKLFCQRQYWWASCMTALLIIPNAITWAFLHANGSASCKELIFVILQLGPALQLTKSWDRGENTVELLWYLAAEGLGEAPLSAVLTCYIVTFGSQTSMTYYVSFVLSFITITKAAVALDHYGQKPSFSQQIVDFMQRLPLVALRITTLACFGFLMKQPGHENHHSIQSTQMALPGWLLYSLLTCVFIISAAEPRCPLSVSIFFGVTMMFTSPMRFLSVFEGMHDFFVVYRYSEIFLMMLLAVCPLAPNPRLFDLIHNAPMLLYIIAISLTLAIACKLVLCLVPIARSCTNWESSTRFRGLRHGISYAEIALDERAEKVRARMHAAVSGGDALMTNLLASIEGANLADPVICRNVHRIFSHEAREAMIKKGMPADLGELVEKDLEAYRSCDDYQDEGDDGKGRTDEAKKLKQAGYSVQELRDTLYFSLEDLYNCGFSAQAFKEAGLEAKHLVDVGFTPREIVDADFSAESIKEAYASSTDIKVTTDLSAEELKEIGIDAKTLHNWGFEAVDLLKAGFQIADVARANFYSEVLLQAGIHVSDLRKAGLTASELNGLGFDAKNMQEAGFTATDLKGGGFDITQIACAGFGAQELTAAGLDADGLKAAGFSPADLKSLGVKATEMVNAGFDATQIAQAIRDPSDLKAAGLTAASLKELGMSASGLKKLGFAAADLKKANYGALELKNVGFAALSLKNCGFSASELKSAGFTVKDLVAVKTTLSELKEVGFTLQDVHSEFDSMDLLQAGFGLPNIIDVIDFGSGRFEAWQKLIKASSPTDLLALARVNAEGGTQVKSGTFESQYQGNWLEIRQNIKLPWTVAQLKEAGLEPSDLVKLVNWEELKRAGWTSSDFRNAVRSAEVKPGCSPAEGKVLE